MIKHKKKKILTVAALRLRFTSISDLCELTNLNPKSVSSRLSELQKLCYVDKTSIDRKIMFKITTQGINWLETILENRK